MGADYPEGHDSPDTGFTYDSLGNRIHIDKQDTAVNYAANSMNQYTSVGDAVYAYDENGNLISDGESAYEYDYENRLISASNLSHASISYEYDPFGRRIEKNVDGAITKYIYDGDQVICETDGSGIITAKYVYGAGIDEVVTMQRGGSVYFYHYDGLGNILDITDGAGSVVESYSYDAYGNSLDSSSVGNPYLFNGRRFDAETGLYYYRARYYDPEIGRFLQTDPVGYEAGTNLYVYVYNNPVNFVDPTGRVIPILALVGIGAAVGAVAGAISYHLTTPPEERTLGGYASHAAIGGAAGAVGAIAFAGLSTAVAGGIGLFGGNVVGGIGAGLSSQGTADLLNISFMGQEGLSSWESYAFAGGSGALGGAIATYFPGLRLRGIPQSTDFRPWVYGRYFGPNSWRGIGQELITDLIGGTLTTGFGAIK